MTRLDLLEYDEAIRDEIVLIYAHMTAEQRRAIRRGIKAQPGLVRANAVLTAICLAGALFSPYAIIGLICITTLVGLCIVQHERCTEGRLLADALWWVLQPRLACAPRTTNTQPEDG